MGDLTGEEVLQPPPRGRRRQLPGLRSLDRPRHNLPVQLTSFVGREAEIREVLGLLGANRLVTLAGAGGCGKTRLALQVAGESLAAREHGAWFVDLSGLSDPDLVAGAVVSAVGLREVPGQSHTETLATQLCDQDALVLLDSCEHVVDTCSALVEALLRSCRAIAVLATSREPLAVSGEVVWRVPGLSLRDEQRPVDIGSLRTSEAARLFIDRASTARPSLAMTNDDAPSLAEVCRRLDGIPLAIELAAARVRMMSVARIAEALSDRFGLLSGGARSALPRHQTLRASVEWSHELLSEPERALLRRLSVLAGGMTLDSAEHVGAADAVEPREVLALLTGLVDKSLVQVNDAGDRYRLLETIRAYAGEKLVAAGEEAATCDRHLSFFAALASRAEKGLWTSEVRSWLDVLGVEHENLRAALDWSLESGRFDVGARLVSDIAQYLNIRGLRSEGLSRFEELLAHDLSAGRRADLYWWAASFAKYTDPAATLRYGESLVALGRETGDDVAVARGLNRMSHVLVGPDPEAALLKLKESLAIARAAGDDITVNDSLFFTAMANFFRGRFPDALRFGEEALALAEQTDMTWGAGRAMTTVASAALGLGELDRAADAGETLLQLGESLGDPFFTQHAHRILGAVGMYRGDPSAAEEMAAARHILERIGDHFNLHGICYYEGLLALCAGRDEDGRRILEEAIPLAERFVQVAGFPVVGVEILSLLAEAAVRRGDLVEASRLLDDVRVAPGLAELLVTRARARLARTKGDHQLALSLADEGLEQAHRSGAQLLVVDLLELTALVAVDIGRHVEAGRLLGAAGKERERLGYIRLGVDQSDFDLANDRIETALGGPGRSAALSEGAGLSIPEAVGYARRGRGQRGRPTSGWASLTPRERNVVQLVAEGLSNAEIAERMFVSTVTVKDHLNHIFGKIGVTNRRELASLARATIV